MGFTNTRVADIRAVNHDNYILQSGQGVTQLITRALYQTLDTIIENDGKIDVLIIILDAEEIQVNQRICQVEKKILDYKREKNVKFNFEYEIFVCNHCFESWLLGNPQLYPESEPDRENMFHSYYSYYNIKLDDPEWMTVPSDIQETTAAYHFHYLHEACRYQHIRYSKKKPMYMASKEYFDMLVNRIESTPHLQSFQEFYRYFIHRH